MDASSPEPAPRAPATSAEDVEAPPRSMSGAAPVCRLRIERVGPARKHPLFHSARRASTGSTLAALRAGIHEARVATPVNVRVMAT